MSGLDRIVEEIRNQAQTEADGIRNQAEEYCRAYMEDARAGVEEEIAAYNKKAQSERDLYEAKTRSGAEFKERNSMLQAKQQCINECLIKAQERINSLPTEEYFQLLEQILKANIQKEKGILYLGEKDFQRIPEGFESNIRKIAQEAGGTLELSKKPSDIKDGFILVYGEIEENCTLKALFDANIDRLKDIANQELFGAQAQKPDRKTAD